jgi:hypothetical protein
VIQVSDHIGGSARLIWPPDHFVSVPAMMGVHDTLANCSWIFMQVIASWERAQCSESVPERRARRRFVFAVFSQGS